VVLGDAAEHGEGGESQAWRPQGLQVRKNFMNLKIIPVPVPVIYLQGAL